MPIIQKLMDNLQRQYGASEGERVYYAMEASAQGPFAKGNEYHSYHVAWAEKHGLPPISTGKKKPRRARPRRG